MARYVDGDRLLEWLDDLEARGRFINIPDIRFIVSELANNCWVSVNDRLPEMYKAVLGYAPFHNNIWAVTMHEDGNWYMWSPVSKRYDPDWEGPITHWAHLPKPPKEDNDE